MKKTVLSLSFIIAQASHKCGDPTIGAVLGGIDFVELVESFKESGEFHAPKRGSNSYVSYVGSYQFWFISDANKQKFAENSDIYIPQYGGYCAWGLTGYDSHVSDPSGYDFGGACINSTNGLQFVTTTVDLQNLWYLKYEAKHDMNVAGAGSLEDNMKLSSINFEAILEENSVTYCFNTDKISKCL